MKKPLGYVTVYKMTEEERLAYIEKHPIRPTKPEKGSSFVGRTDYAWRHDAAREASRRARRG